jgi:hypothetical protein
MMIKQEISLDELDIYKVSVETKQFVEVDGVLYQIGTPHRRAYSNSAQDRTLIAEELAEPYLSAVMAVWGDSPTIFPPPAVEHVAHEAKTQELN